MLYLYWYVEATPIYKRLPYFHICNEIIIYLQVNMQGKDIINFKTCYRKTLKIAADISFHIHFISMQYLQQMQQF